MDTSSTYKTTFNTFTTSTTEVVVTKGNANFPDTTYDQHKDSGLVGTGLSSQGGKAYSAGSTYKPQN